MDTVKIITYKVRFTFGEKDRIPMVEKLKVDETVKPEEFFYEKLMELERKVQEIAQANKRTQMVAETMVKGAGSVELTQKYVE